MNLFVVCLSLLLLLFVCLLLLLIDCLSLLLIVCLFVVIVDCLLLVVCWLFVVVGLFCFVLLFDCLLFLVVGLFACRCLIVPAVAKAIFPSAIVPVRIVLQKEEGVDCSVLQMAQDSLVNSLCLVCLVISVHFKQVKSTKKKPTITIT